MSFIRKSFISLRKKIMRQEESDQTNSPPSAEPAKIVCFSKYLEEIDSMTQLNDFRKILLIYGCNFDTNLDDEVEWFQQTYEATTLFQTGPLSQTEKEHLKMLRPSAAGLKGRLALLSENADNWVLTSRLTPIYEEDFDSIHRLDSSKIPRLRSQDLFDLIKRLYGFTQIPVVAHALQNIFVAAPRLLTGCKFSDLRNVVEMMCEKDPQLVCLKPFYQSMHSMISFKKGLKEFTDSKEITDRPDRIWAALLLALCVNKQEDIHSDKFNAKLIIDILIKTSIIANEELTIFLDNLELQRMLYYMKSFYEEFLNYPSRRYIPLKAIKLVEKRFENALLDRISDASSSGPSMNKLLCMLIEHITLWTDSSVLAINLALRWAYFTECSLLAIDVLHTVLFAIEKFPDSVSSETTLNRPLLKRFLKFTCNGNIYRKKLADRKTYSEFYDWAVALRKYHGIILGWTPPKVSILDSKDLTEPELLTSLRLTYFSTSKIFFKTHQRLLSSYHVLHFYELNQKLELREYPDDVQAGEVSQTGSDSTNSLQNSRGQDEASPNPEASNFRLEVNPHAQTSTFNRSS